MMIWDGVTSRSCEMVFEQSSKPSVGSVMRGSCGGGVGGKMASTSMLNDEQEAGLGRIGLRSRNGSYSELEWPPGVHGRFTMVSGSLIRFFGILRSGIGSWWSRGLLGIPAELTL